MDRYSTSPANCEHRPSRRAAALRAALVALVALVAVALVALVAPDAVAQPARRVDLMRSPWSTVMDTLHDRGDLAGQRELERLGAERSLAAWERAHALRWAGRLAMNHGRLADAARDLEAARRADPGGFDARMAQVHLGELAIREKRWFDAERLLAPLARDDDAIVAAYASDRLAAVRERTRRLRARYASAACLALGAALLARRVARAAKRRRPGALASFGRALLALEALAIAGAVVVPRATTSLAASGWMAFAIPAALVVAAVWATREPAAPRARRALAVAIVAAALAAGLYVALDATWWSVARPVLEG